MARRWKLPRLPPAETLARRWVERLRGAERLRQVEHRRRAERRRRRVPRRRAVRRMAEAAVQALLARPLAAAPARARPRAVAAPARAAAAKPAEIARGEACASLLPEKLPRVVLEVAEHLLQVVVQGFVHDERAHGAFAGLYPVD